MDSTLFSDKSLNVVCNVMIITALCNDDIRFECIWTLYTVLCVYIQYVLYMQISLRYIEI